MSRSIADSLSLLSETLGNCKTNLKEKSVEDVDNIKISDVDEKIAEIESGGLDPNFFEDDYCLVIAKGYYNPNDHTTKPYPETCNFGENLQYQIHENNIYVKQINSHNYYIYLISTIYKKLRLTEVYTDDNGNKRASTGEIDISKSGILLVEMSV